jgi:hypothetical protein
LPSFVSRLVVLYSVFVIDVGFPFDLTNDGHGLRKLPGPVLISVRRQCVFEYVEVWENILSGNLQLIQRDFEGRGNDGSSGRIWNIALQTTLLNLTFLIGRFFNTKISRALGTLRRETRGAGVSNAVFFTFLAFSFFRVAHPSPGRYVGESNLALRVVVERKLGFRCTFGKRVDLSMSTSHLRSYFWKMPAETEETILGCLQ